MTEKQEAYSKYISAMAELLLHEKYSVDEITEILKDDWEAAYENAGLQDHALDVGKAFTDMSIDQRQEIGPPILSRRRLVQSSLCRVAILKSLILSPHPQKHSCLWLA